MAIDDLFTNPNAGPGTISTLRDQNLSTSDKLKVFFTPQNKLFEGRKTYKDRRDVVAQNTRSYNNLNNSASTLDQDLENLYREYENTGVAGGIFATLPEDIAGQKLTEYYNQKQAQKKQFTDEITSGSQELGFIYNPLDHILIRGDNAQSRQLASLYATESGMDFKTLGFGKRFDFANSTYGFNEDGDFDVLNPLVRVTEVRGNDARSYSAPITKRGGKANQDEPITKQDINNKSLYDIIEAAYIPSYLTIGRFAGDPSVARFIDYVGLDDDTINTATDPSSARPETLDSVVKTADKLTLVKEALTQAESIMDAQTLSLSETPGSSFVDPGTGERVTDPSMLLSMIYEVDRSPMREKFSPLGISYTNTKNTLGDTSYIRTTGSNPFNLDDASFASFSVQEQNRLEKDANNLSKENEDRLQKAILRKIESTKNKRSQERGDAAAVRADNATVTAFYKNKSPSYMINMLKNRPDQLKAYQENPYQFALNNKNNVNSIFGDPLSSTDVIALEDGTQKVDFSNVERAITEKDIQSLQKEIAKLEAESPENATASGDVTALQNKNLNRAGKKTKMATMLKIMASLDPNDPRFNTLFQQFPLFLETGLLYDTSAILKRQFDMSQPPEVENATNLADIRKVRAELKAGELDNAALTLRTLPVQNAADLAGKKKMSVEYLRQWVDKNASARGFINKVIAFFGFSGDTEQALDTFKAITAIGPNEKQIRDPDQIKQAVKFKLGGSILEITDNQALTGGGDLALSILRQLAADQLILNRNIGRGQ
jgi:hypothetical protein